MAIPRLLLVATTIGGLTVPAIGYGSDCSEVTSAYASSAVPTTTPARASQGSSQFCQQLRAIGGPPAGSPMTAYATSVKQVGQLLHHSGLPEWISGEDLECFGRWSPPVHPNCAQQMRGSMRSRLEAGKKAHDTHSRARGPLAD